MLSSTCSIHLCTARRQRGRQAGVPQVCMFDKMGGGASHFATSVSAFISYVWKTGCMLGSCVGEGISFNFY